VLFSAEDEGEDDAEEYHSIRSSKIGWDQAVEPARDLVEQHHPQGNGTAASVR